MTQDENIQEKIKDFVELMMKIVAHEQSHPWEIEETEEFLQCSRCKHPVCKMVQKNNPPLKCFLSYIDNYGDT